MKPGMPTKPRNQVTLSDHENNLWQSLCSYSPGYRTHTPKIGHFSSFNAVRISRGEKRGIPMKFWKLETLGEDGLWLFHDRKVHLRSVKLNYRPAKAGRSTFNQIKRTISLENFADQKLTPRFDDWWSRKDCGERSLGGSENSGINLVSTDMPSKLTASMFTEGELIVLAPLLSFLSMIPFRAIVDIFFFFSFHRWCPLTLGLFAPTSTQYDVTMDR